MSAATLAPVVLPTDVERAWMAGFVDGEGCLMILRQIRKDRPSPAYRASVTVSNTVLSALEPFQRFYGGTVHSVHETRADAKGKPWADAHEWRCPDGAIPLFLEDILPFLRIKHEQARLILEFWRTKNAFKRKFWPGQGGGSAPLSDDEISHRERLRVAVRMLNKKGTFARWAEDDHA